MPLAAGASRGHLSSQNNVDRSSTPRGEHNHRSESPTRPGAEYADLGEALRARLADPNAQRGESWESGERFRGKNVLPHQERVRQIYQSTHVQLTIACVIVVAFIVNICEREIDPYPMPYKQYPKTWATLDDIFNTMFLLELLFNLYGTWFCDFWRSGWNIFDLLVVVVGICTITRADLGVFNDLKMLRAFRVFRLFKRVKSLNSIIVNLIQSIPGVLSAFSLTLIVMSVYAILAVEWFRDLAWHDEEGVYDEGRYGTLMDLKVRCRT